MNSQRWGISWEIWCKPATLKGTVVGMRRLVIKHCFYLFLLYHWMNTVFFKKKYDSFGNVSVASKNWQYIAGKFMHPIDLIFGTYNVFSLYFQLIETTWFLISFHSNHSHINDVTSSRHLGFSHFQIVFIFELNNENGEEMTFSDWNLQNCKIHCKFVSTSLFFSENSHLFSAKIKLS